MAGEGDRNRTGGAGLPLGLAALLLMVVVVAIGILAWKASRGDRVTAHLEVRESPSISGQVTTRRPAQQRPQDSATQIALLKSPLIISAALQAPGIAALPSVQKQSDPETWLLNRLDARFASDSPVFEMRLESRPPNGEDDAKILSAIIAAQQAEVAKATAAGAVDWTLRVIQQPMVTSN